MRKTSWRIASASAAGLAHINQNTECQDRLAHRTITTGDGEILIAAVADGAGSAELGACGAELACRLFVGEAAAFLRLKDGAVRLLGEDFGRRLIAYLQQKIAQTAREAGKSPGDYASTLIGAVVGRDCAAFFQIGDGGVVYSVSGAPQSYRFAVAPAEALYVNMTDFVTDETAAEQLRFALVTEPVEDLILFSDGIFPVAVNYRTNEPHEPFLLPMIAPLRRMSPDSGSGTLNEKLAAFLASPKINEKSDDDKTIILASRAASMQASSPANVGTQAPSPANVGTQAPSPADAA